MRLQDPRFPTVQSGSRAAEYHAADGVLDLVRAGLKAAQGITEAVSQGHISAGVGWACVGVVAAGLQMAGKAMESQARQLDDAELAAARALQGLGYAASAAGTAHDFVGIAESRHPGEAAAARVASEVALHSTPPG